MEEKTAALSEEDCPAVKIIARESLVPYFRSIFQAGFLFHCQVGLSIEDLFFRQLALDRELVEKKVSTVFLDGQCVDDIASTTINEGSVVALSSALPGLAGATLRRGGFYACLRDSITYRTEDSPARSQQGTITIKLFNLLMEELGPVFLRKGICVSRSEFAGFLQCQKETFWKEIRVACLGGKIITPRELSDERTYGDADYVAINIDDRGTL